MILIRTQELKTRQISIRLWRYQTAFVVAMLCKKTGRKESRNAIFKVGRRHCMIVITTALSTTFCLTLKQKLINYLSKTQICSLNCNHSPIPIFKATSVLLGTPTIHIQVTSFQIIRQNPIVHLQIGEAHCPHFSENFNL